MTRITDEMVEAANERKTLMNESGPGAMLFNHRSEASKSSWQSCGGDER